MKMIRFLNAGGLFKKSKKSAKEEICLMKKMELTLVKCYKDFNQNHYIKGTFLSVK